MNNLKALPSVDSLLHSSEFEELECGHEFLVSVIRDELASVRKQIIRAGAALPAKKELVQRVVDKVNQILCPGMKQVINATGVILHTNLGRAPLSRQAVENAVSVVEDYSNLEFDLADGKRGKRLSAVEPLLVKLTGAEAAVVVNNNAASLLLILSAFAKRKEVIISRTQLIEIGDGFRIPDVMRQSGAKLKEVGSTNKVNLNDYAEAISPSSAMIMRAHHSNYKIVGFTDEPDLAALVKVAHENRLPLVDDLGSGTLIDTGKYGLKHEPTIQESIKAGADLVCFSGDKLLGGPQAGIIAGKNGYIDKLKKHPLMRALRVGKLTLATLEVTLLHYLASQYEWRIPIWKMVSATLSSLEQRAIRWRRIICLGEVQQAYSTIGGGSLPEETLPTFVLAIKVDNPDKLLKSLREMPKPVIARIENGQVMFDPRTVRDEDEADLINELRVALTEMEKSENEK